MGDERNKHSIGRILDSLPGDLALVRIDGTLLARKGPTGEAAYASWPWIPLFSGTGRACRLHWRPATGYDPAVMTGPLELLLGDLIVSGPEYWFKRLLTEPAHTLDMESFPISSRGAVPVRLGVLKLRETAVTETLEALQALLPDLKTVMLAPGCMIVTLPTEPEMAQDWSESMLALLAEELMVDPLIIAGEVIINLGMLHPHALALESLCKSIYAQGGRGIQSLMGHLPELIMGRLIDSPEPLIRDLGRIIEPVQKDPDLSLTASVFIQANLSIAETAQNLFIHRNTLVYRLSKIEKLTGLDLKRLDQAMAFVLLKAAQAEESAT